MHILYAKEMIQHPSDLREILGEVQLYGVSSMTLNASARAKARPCWPNTPALGSMLSDLDSMVLVLENGRKELQTQDIIRYQRDSSGSYGQMYSSTFIFGSEQIESV